MYEYAIWVGILAVIWVLFYAIRKDLRKKILYSSILAMPFGIGEILFIPNYWTPQTFFDLGIKYSVDIEAFLLMFFLGGLAGAIYEVLTKKRMKKTNMCHTACTCYLGLVITLTFLVVLMKITNWDIIFVSSYACLAGGAFAFFRYKTLRKHIVMGGITFMLLYGVSLAIMNMFFPTWITSTWIMQNLSGILILGVPLEELLFGFAFGTLWAPLYEEVCFNLKIK